MRLHEFVVRGDGGDHVGIAHRLGGVAPVAEVLRAALGGAVGVRSVNKVSSAPSAHASRFSRVAALRTSLRSAPAASASTSSRSAMSFDDVPVAAVASASTSAQRAGKPLPQLVTPVLLACRHAPAHLVGPQIVKGTIGAIESFTARASKFDKKWTQVGCGQPYDALHRPQMHDDQHFDPSGGFASSTTSGGSSSRSTSPYVYPVPSSLSPSSLVRLSTRMIRLEHAVDRPGGIKNRTRAESLEGAGHLSPRRTRR